MLISPKDNQRRLYGNTFDRGNSIVGDAAKDPEVISFDAAPDDMGWKERDATVEGANPTTCMLVEIVYEKSQILSITIMSWYYAG